MVIFETLTVLRKMNQDDEKLKYVYNSLTDLKVYSDVEY
jgi:hypothetical protein